MLDALIADLRAENETLDGFVSALPSDAWRCRTAFFDWTVRDQILHLHQVDRFGLSSLTEDAPFADTVAAVRAHQAQGIELSAAIRREFADVDDATVLAIWRTDAARLADALAAAPPGTRLDWFGPPMGVASFASARIMEVWAHGQDIYDLFAAFRPATMRLRHICELGVRTFGWSFRNRGLDIPLRPAVRLTLPGDQQLAWEGEAEAGSVTGSARDFALVVTQRRAPVDTALVADGAVAEQWLAIAQCFAGAPQTPPAPGSRPALD